MTEENKAKLLQAYQYAVQAGQDGIAELLQDVILGEMTKERKPATRGQMVDDMPLTPYGSRHVVTCELREGAES